MIVQVKAKHIREGTRDSCVSCPIALALEETTGCEIAVVRYGFIFTSNQGELPVFYKTTKVVKKFINNFDEKGKRAVEPCRLSLKVITREQAITGAGYSLSGI